MSVIQDKISELRFLKQENLKEESRIIGNYFRDIIHSYGIDCRFYKLKTNYPTEFSTYVDEHSSVMHAYGYDSNVKFSDPIDMITFMSVENDIFNLNMYGIIPNGDVTFYFDGVEFATRLASRFGPIREYEIVSQDIDIDFTGTNKSDVDLKQFSFSIPIKTKTENISGSIVCTFDLSNLDDPEFLQQMFTDSDVTVSTTTDDDVSETVTTVTTRNFSGIHPEKISDIKLDLPINRYLHNSADLRATYQYVAAGNVMSDGETIFLHDIINDMKLKFDFKISYDKKIESEADSSADNISENSENSEITTPPEYPNSIFDNCKITGTISGSILIRDPIREIDKYVKMLQPNVGDVITIGFPHESCREQYEITSCTNKDLAANGINPLLHKYIWKCNARRYIHSNEGNIPEANLANDRMNEKLEFVNDASIAYANKIEAYDTISSTTNKLDKLIFNIDSEDDYYGGYNKPNLSFESNNKPETASSFVFQDDITSNARKEQLLVTEFLDESQLIQVAVFSNNAELVTDGYDLYFKHSLVNSDTTVKYYKLSNAITNKSEISKTDLLDNISKLNKNSKYLKATDDVLVFVNIEGEITVLAVNPRILEKYNNVITISDGDSYPVKANLSLDDFRNIFGIHIESLETSSNMTSSNNFDKNKQTNYKDTAHTSTYNFSSCNTFIFVDNISDSNFSLNCAFTKDVINVVQLV